MVFAGTREGFGPLAIKRLKVGAEKAGHRELRIADELAGKSYKHVIPILDSGLDAESNAYFVVMARAEKSLQDEIDSGRRFSDSEAADVMFQIAKGLKETSIITHRDLKPANVLYHEGKWKVADFGIARFVGESSSLQTLKGYLSPAYAAPEQWRDERATEATDVYALGCIAHAIITGSPPFCGAAIEDYREQHLGQAPPELTNCSPQMRSAVSIMLRKLPEARPSIERVCELCRRIAEAQPESNSGMDIKALLGVAAQAAQRQAEEEARRSAYAREWERRIAIAEEASQILMGIIHQLVEEVTVCVPTAEILFEWPEPKLSIFLIWLQWLSPSLWRWIILGQEKPLLLSVRLQDVRLEAHYFTQSKAPYFSSHRKVLARNNFQRSGWDVILGARLFLQKRGQEIVSRSLWYTNLGIHKVYRWYEVGYSRHSWFGQSSVGALEPMKADRPLTRKGRYEISAGPVPIDDEDAKSFCSRWLKQFSAAFEN